MPRKASLVLSQLLRFSSGEKRLASRGQQHSLRTLPENQISGIILDAAIAVHTALGPGLLESAYQACLIYELNSRGLKVQTQVPLPISYRGVLIDAAYRLDLVVDDLVIIELKAVERLMPIHEAQLL